MARATSAIFNLCDNQPNSVKLLVWSNTGDVFQNRFSCKKTTFAYAKSLAMQVLLKESAKKPSSSMVYIALHELCNYRLMTVQIKSTDDEQKPFIQVVEGEA